MKILFGQKHWCFLLRVIFLFLFYLFIFHRVTLSWRTQGEKPSCCPGWNILILSPSEKPSKVRKKTLLLINCFYLDCKQCDVVFLLLLFFCYFVVDGLLCVVMEFCSGGDLLQRIKQQKSAQFCVNDVNNYNNNYFFFFLLISTTFFL